MRRHLAGWLLGLIMALALMPMTALAEGKSTVYVLRIDQGQTIDAGLARFADRVFAQAESDPNAAAILIVLDTPGGYVDSAAHIKDRILNSKLTSIAYVEGGAISAGALIATAAEQIYMHPGSVIGAAEPRIAGTNEPADYKALNVVAGYFESAAVFRGRDPKIARAMVDTATPIEGQKGALLALNYQEAIQTRYANGEAASLEDAARKAGIADFDLVETEWTFSERAGRLLTTPFVATLLLVLGVIAIGIEFIKPGVTVPGLIGVVCLGLFFLGNTLVGTAGWVEISLALIGILLIVIEAFIPGFGVFGIGGVLAMGGSIFLAVPSSDLAWQYLMWTAIASTVALFGIVRAISRRGLGKALTLSDSARGWTTPRTDLTALVGREGESLSVLRPAGTARFGDQKLDVVTEGDFIPAGKRVRIIRVEGTRVVVRASQGD